MSTRTVLSIDRITQLQLNSEVTATMKRAQSKTTFKKNKTVSATINDSKKSSRVVKANSCIKINSQNTEQHSCGNTLTLNPPLARSALQQLSHKMLSNTNHILDKAQRPSSRNHIAKSSIETVPSRDILQQRPNQTQLRQTNEQLIQQNTQLKQKCCQLQEMSLRDKQKIKNLIIRINEVKNQQPLSSGAKTIHPSTAKLTHHEPSYSLLPLKIKIDTPYKDITSPCDNRECHERKKYLEGQLYRERIERDKLEMERREWEKNKHSLKQQYNDLLDEIREIRQAEP